MEGVQINVLAQTFYIKFGLDASHGTNNGGFTDGICECSREIDGSWSGSDTNYRAPFTLNHERENLKNWNHVLMEVPEACGGITEPVLISIPSLPKVFIVFHDGSWSDYTLNIDKDSNRS